VLDETEYRIAFGVDVQSEQFPVLGTQFNAHRDGLALPPFQFALAAHAVDIVLERLFVDGTAFALQPVDDLGARVAVDAGIAGPIVVVFEMKWLEFGSALVGQGPFPGTDPGCQIDVCGLRHQSREKEKQKQAAVHEVTLIHMPISGS
jgi:hypothetical protein